MKSTRKLKKLRDKGSRLLADEQYREALAVFEELSALEPEDMFLKIKVGDLHKKTGKSTEAIVTYEQAAESFAHDGMMLRGIAVCRMILEIDPLHQHTQELLAELYTKKYGALPRIRQREPIEKGDGEKASVAKTELDSPHAKRLSTPEAPVVDVDVDVDVSAFESSEAGVESEATEAAVYVISEDLIDDLLVDDELEEEDEEVTYDHVIAEELPHIPLFSDLDKESFIELLGRVTLHRVDQGDYVVREGEIGESFFVIASGSVDVIREPGMYLAELAEGAFFGEMAIIAPAPRRASVVAREPSELIEVSKGVLEQLEREHPHIEEVLKRFTEDRMLNNLILTSPLFTPFEQNERDSLRRQFVCMRYSPGDEIVRTGEDVMGLHLIIFGKAEILLGNGPFEKRITEISEGQMFGETSLLTRSPANVTVRAIDELHTLTLHRSKFNEIIMTHPQILIMASELSERRKELLESGEMDRALASGEGEGTALL